MKKSSREDVLGVLVASAARYLGGLGGETPEIGAAVPLVAARRREALLDFAARIDVSGDQHGFIILSLERTLAEKLVRRLGEAGKGAAVWADVTGEAANTIVGNARRELGAEFRISVPELLDGPDPKWPQPGEGEVRIVTFEVAWGCAYLMVCLGLER